MNDIQKTDRQIRIEKLAGDIISNARNRILMNSRFLKHALSAVSTTPVTGSASVRCDGTRIYYDPALIIRRFRSDPAAVVRIIMHILLHFAFHHNDNYASRITDLWDLACDISVESVILDMELPGCSLRDDPERKIKLSVISERAGGMHVQALYRMFRVEGISEREREDLERLFVRDSHELWMPTENIEITEEMWKRISERIKADVKSFSDGSTVSDSLKASLEQATVERVDYSDFLRRFMVVEETIRVSDDEFDYIYYTYGLEHYGNMPLIEPLEYSDDAKIRDFAIAIDTSASCSGRTVEAFLRRTVEILSDADSFFHEYNVHIIQCDSSVRSDTVVHNTEELTDYISDLKIHGSGSTDFRPVFEYIDDLISKGVFLNLKGLLYFTDGFGIYPERMPGYDTAFVFLNDDRSIPDVPGWAIRVVLDEDQLSVGA